MPMPPFISPQLMDRTWKKMATVSPREMLRIQKSHRKDQGPLTLFVARALHAFREDACGLLLYVYHVVMQASQQAEPRPKRVSRRQIEQAMATLGQEPTVTAYQAGTLPAREPHALKYVYEAFTEADDDVTLTQEELESFFDTMYLVVECLHEACGSRRR